MRKEPGKRRLGACVELDGARPALPGAQHIAVGKAAAGHQPGKVHELHAAFKHVGHVHVYRLESGLIKRPSHFSLAVDALLAEDGDLGPLRGVRREAWWKRINALAHRKTGILLIGQRLEGLARAVGVVAQRGQPVAGLGPGLVQLHPRRGIALGAVHEQADLVVCTGRAQRLDGEACRQPIGGKGIGIALVHLHHHAQLFGEQLADEIAFGQVDAQSAMSGKGHFQQGDQQAAVGAVVVGQQAAVVPALDQIPGRLELRGLVQVGRDFTEFTVNLRQRRPAETVAAVAQIDQQQPGVGVWRELRRQAAAHIRHRREGGDHQRHWGGLLLLGTGVIAPLRLHRQRILAHRDAQAQRRAELLAHRAHRVEQAGVFIALTAGGHPVGRQPHVRQPGDLGGGDIGDAFGHRHTARCRSVEQRQRRALTHGHGLAGGGGEAGGGDGAVGHRHLPGADHLVTHRQAAHRAVTDGDEKFLGRHGRQPQHPGDGFIQHHLGQLAGHRSGAAGRTTHARRLAQQHLHGQVHRVWRRPGVVNDELRRGGGGADHGHGAALARAGCFDHRQPLGPDGQHIALLAFVAPDFHRRQRWVGRLDVAQLEMPAATIGVHQFREGVGHPTRADIVNRQNRVGVAELPAGIDNLLTAALQLGVGALHAGKVQRLGGAAGGHGTGRAAAQTDQHRRAAEHQQQRAFDHRQLVHMAVAHAAVAARDHDGLVITAIAAIGHHLFQRPEIAVEARPAEFVVVGRRPDRGFEHDRQRRRHACGPRQRGFPRLLEAGNPQVGGVERGQTRLGLAATTRCRLVTNLAAAAGRRARIGADARRVVVGFHLHQNVHGLFMPAPDAVGFGEPAHRRRSGHHRRVVLVGRQHALGRGLEGEADHVEQ